VRHAAAAACTALRSTVRPFNARHSNPQLAGVLPLSTPMPLQPPHTPIPSPSTSLGALRRPVWWYCPCEWYQSCTGRPPHTGCATLGKRTYGGCIHTVGRVHIHAAVRLGNGRCRMRRGSAVFLDSALQHQRSCHPFGITTRGLHSQCVAGARIIWRSYGAVSTTERA